MFEQSAATDVTGPADGARPPGLYGDLPFARILKLVLGPNPVEPQTLRWRT